MAYKPSARRSSPPQEVDLNILPVMNLMACLIPILLSAAEFVKTAVVPVNLPAASGGGGGAAEDKPKEVEKRLGLVVTITEQGFTIGNAATVLAPIPKKDGKFDFRSLNEKLKDLKSRIEGEGYIDTDQATLTSAPDIDYQSLIFTMDAMSIYWLESGEAGMILFPNVSIGVLI
jgi:biopolymer transport protein ExbD